MDTTGNRPFTELAVRNATDFLQTVVVVDDKPQYSFGTKSADAPKSDGEGSVSGPQIRSTTSGLTVPDPEDLAVQRLVDVFAQEGIACTLLCPTSDHDNDIVRRVTRVAKRADIVILDWILNHDNGRKAIDILLKLLIEDGASSNRMRLVAIYTGSADLDRIASEVAQALTGQFGKGAVQSSDFFIRWKSACIVIFAKEDSRIPDIDSRLFQRKVAVEDLPKTLIDEFANMTVGLMPNVAIVALTELRAQMHKLLSVFSSVLDPAYLGHRLLLPIPPESEDQVVALLAAEIQSVLNSGSVRAQVDSEVIGKWLAERCDSLRLERLPVSPIPNADELLVGLETGFGDDSNSHRLSSVKWSWKCATHAFSPCDDLADRSNRRLAILMQMKTRYGGRPPFLTLGTVLYSCGTYWFCLQARCDSVRINGCRSFPLVPMKRINATKKAIDVVVEDFEIVLLHGSDWVYLKLPLTPFEMRMIEFRANEETKQVTASATDESCQAWELEAVGRLKFEWVAELKDEMAQRIVNDYSAKISRVGVNDPEWVRRSGRSRS